MIPVFQRRISYQSTVILARHYSYPSATQLVPSPTTSSTLTWTKAADSDSGTGALAIAYASNDAGSGATIGQGAIIAISIICGLLLLALLLTLVYFIARRVKDGKKEEVPSAQLLPDTPPVDVEAQAGNSHGFSHHVVHLNHVLNGNIKHQNSGEAASQLGEAEGLSSQRRPNLPTEQEQWYPRPPNARSSRGPEVLNSRRSSMSGRSEASARRERTSSRRRARNSAP